MDLLHDRKTLLIAATLASTFCFTPVFAQKANGDPAQRPEKKRDQSMQKAEAGQDAQQKQRVMLVGHGDIIGTKVDNGMKADAMAELGSISDLVVRPDGAIDAVIIRTGTTLGLGGSEVEYPWKSLKWSPDCKSCSIQMTQDQFARLPKFDREARAAEASASKSEGKGEGKNESDEKRTEPMLATEWIDLPLRTANDDFGAPDELVIETGSGTVAFSAVSIGGVLGIGDTTILVPWSATKLVEGVDDEADPHLMLSATRETLRNAPALDNRKEQLASNEYRAKVYKHFDVDMPAFEKHARKKGEHDDMTGHGKKDDGGYDSSKNSGRKDG
jgi:hypothetical protein